MNHSNIISRIPIWLWLIPLLLVVTWLGARGLNADPVWSDERLSIFDAGGGPYDPRNLIQIWQGVSSRNPWHAPGYFMLLNTWGRLVGWQPPALRAMSLLFGVLAVACTYRLGSEMVSRRVGLYAAAIMGTSVLFVHYLHELRMYSLFSLLTAFTLWMYWRIINREPSKFAWVGLLVGAVAMLYTHYFAALPLFAIGLYHLLFVKKTRRWWQVVGVLALAGLLFLPWFSSLVVGLTIASSDQIIGLRVRAAAPHDIIERMVYFFGDGSVLLVVAVAVLALAARQRGARQVWFFMLAVVAFTLLVNAVVRIMPVTRMRYLLGLWPLLALVAGLGIDQLRRWRPAHVLTLGVWLLLGIMTSVNLNFVVAARVDGAGDQWNIFPWHIATTVFREHTQPGDPLVLNVPDGIGHIPLPEHLTPEFYLGGSGVRITVVGSMTTREQEQEALQSVLEFVSESPRVWVAYEPDRRSVVLPTFEDNLSEAYGLCEAGLSGLDYQFDLYSRAPICCMPDGTPPRLRFGSGIALVGQEPMPEQVTDTLPVTLSWSIADDVPDYTYSVALHVLDAGGELVAQADYGLPVSSTACQESSIALGDLPAGEYQLFVIVYAWASGERLPGEVVATGERGDRLLLGTFRI